MKKSRTPMRRRRSAQQKFQLTRPAPGDKPYPSAEFYSSGWWSLPKAIKRRSVLICALEWAWSPATNRMEAYFLHQGRTHWMLWAQAYDDGIVGTVGVVKYLRKELGKRDAAMMLLAACLDKKRREEDLDRFHLISPDFKEGLLSEQELNAVADVVWG